MSKFVFIYHAPMTPAEATPASPEDMEAVMGDWNAWAAKVGDGLIDFGTPLANGVRVSPGGPRLPASARSRDTASSRPKTSTPPSNWPKCTAPQHARRMRNRSSRRPGNPRNVGGIRSGCGR